MNGDWGKIGWWECGRGKLDGGNVGEGDWMVGMWEKENGGWEMWERENGGWGMREREIERDLRVVNVG